MSFLNQRLDILIYALGHKPTKPWLHNQLLCARSNAMSAYICFSCSKVTPLVNEDTKKCPRCGSSNGEVISNERVKEGMDSGAFFNIDPKTGKRAKKKDSLQIHRSSVEAHNKSFKYAPSRLDAQKMRAA